MTTEKNTRDLAQVFDEIAPSWYNRFHWTRFKQELEELAERWVDGDLLNLGCGHGADFIPFKDSFELYGVDFSPGMLKQAARYAKKFNFHVNLTATDIRNLPYENDSFDWAIAVATYHHLKGRVEITRGFEELFRVIKPGGEAFVTLWNHWQPRFWFKPKILYVPWQTQERLLKRYYYLTNYFEAVKMAKAGGFDIIYSKPESGYHFPLKYFSKNICLLLKKPAKHQN